jgi:two-component sensor histidine kinase
MRVVIIDDCEADRSLYRSLLDTEPAHRRALEFLEAPTAVEGLELCRAASPDCVLLDYHLPDMSGVEFLTRLRAGSPAEIPDFAVVMVSGMESDRVAVEVLKAGAQDYLPKHRLTAERLKVTVETATQKVSALRALKAERDSLARSLAAKEVLLEEVHHRVKNNLQTIASLLELQAGAVPDHNTAAAIRASRNRVEAMAVVHNQLYQNSSDLATHTYMLANNLFRSYGVEESRIRLDVAMAPLPLSIDRAMPAGLILNELISNALKHAFPRDRHGFILVSGAITGTGSGARITLEVQDAGVGLPAEWNLEQTPSLGLRIVRTLTRQLQGTFECGARAADGDGSVFRVTFPVN